MEHTGLDDSELATVDPERALDLVARLLEDRGPRLTRHFHEAIQAPSRHAVERYVDDYRAAIKKLLVVWSGEPSESVETGQFREWSTSPWRFSTAELGAAEAAHSPWVEAYGPEGLLLDMADRVRRQHPELPQFELPRPPRKRSAEAGRESEPTTFFYKTVLRVLAEERDEELPLGQVQRALDLSVTDLGRLFGVSRQAAAQWIESRAVPADRQMKLHALLAVVDLLERKLKPGRLPGVARTPAPDWDGLTLLEMIEQDRHLELLERVRASFDWSVAA